MPLRTYESCPSWIGRALGGLSLSRCPDCGISGFEMGVRSFLGYVLEDPLQVGGRIARVARRVSGGFLAACRQLRCWSQRTLPAFNRPSTVCGVTGSGIRLTSGGFLASTFFFRCSGRCRAPAVCVRSKPSPLYGTSKALTDQAIALEIECTGMHRADRTAIAVA